MSDAIARLTQVEATLSAQVLLALAFIQSVPVQTQSAIDAALAGDAAAANAIADKLQADADLLHAGLPAPIAVAVTAVATAAADAAAAAPTPAAAPAAAADAAATAAAAAAPAVDAPSAAATSAPGA